MVYRVKHQLPFLKLFPWLIFFTVEVFGESHRRNICPSGTQPLTVTLALQRRHKCATVPPGKPGAPTRVACHHRSEEFSAVPYLKSAGRGSSNFRNPATFLYANRPSGLPDSIIAPDGPHGCRGMGELWPWIQASLPIA